MTSAANEIERFQDEDGAYLNWLAAHPAGFVINIQRALNPSDARLHLASCRTITDDPPRGGPRTGPYIKVCSDNLSDLDAWATTHTGGPITACGICAPPRATPGRTHAPVPSSRRAGTSTEDRAIELAGGSEVHGPTVGRSVVEAWSDQYVPFEHRSAAQDSLRADLRERIAKLKARPGHVLHGTFFGEKHPAADIENLVLYNVDDTGTTFDATTRTGLRFELGHGCPPSPTGLRYAFGYRYELAPATTRFRYWRERRTLASWGWIELDALPHEHKLENVWHALKRTDIDVAPTAREADTPFAVRVALRAPITSRPAPGGLVKGVFDGVISAFQAQSDHGDITELATRVSRTLHTDPADIKALLSTQDQAPLGTKTKLLHRRGDGVQWAPSDELCLAGELIVETSTATTWAIKGTIVELERA